MLVLVMIGLIMKATCKNIRVHTFLYWVEPHQSDLCRDHVANMTSLRNRMIMLGLNGRTRYRWYLRRPGIAALFYANLGYIGHSVRLLLCRSGLYPRRCGDAVYATSGGEERCSRRLTLDVTGGSPSLTMSSSSMVQYSSYTYLHLTCD